MNKTILKRLLSAFLFFCIFTSFNLVLASNDEILNVSDITGVTLTKKTDGYKVVGVPVDLRQKEIKEQSIKAFRKVRRELYNENIYYYGEKIQDVAKKVGINNADEFANSPKWSSDLEKIAIQRLAEVLITNDHTRVFPDEDIFDMTVKENGSGFNGEVLAWGNDIYDSIVEQWIGGEKKANEDLKGKYSFSNGHLLILMNPNLKSFAFSTNSSGLFGFTNVGVTSTYIDGDDLELNFEGKTNLPVAVPTNFKGLREYAGNGKLVSNWVKKENNWYYNKKNKELAKSEWIYDEEYVSWYYFDNEGKMISNKWMFDEKYNSWYYFVPSGKMAKSEWIFDKNYDSWYYFGLDGKMAKSKWIFDYNYYSLYYFNKDGKMAKSEWIYDKEYKSWYYANSDGKIAKNQWIFDKKYNSFYYFRSDGKMAKSEWAYDEYYNSWYYLNEDGKMVKSKWIKHTDGKWYYLLANGKMAKNQYVDGYYLNYLGRWE